MATPQFVDFNRSGRTLQGLRTLAQTDPASATAYLTAVRNAAASAATNDPAIAAIDRILSSNDVFSAIQNEGELGRIFPDGNASNWVLCKPLARRPSAGQRTRPRRPKWFLVF
jgi:hypothetical protein